MRTLRTLLPLAACASIAMAQSAGPAITTTSLPNGTVNVGYNAAFACTNCNGFTWSVSSGFPPGLSVNATTGAITGIPTTTNFYSFIVTLNTFNTPVTKSLSIYISPPPLVITTPSLPNGVLGTPYSQTLSASGGMPAYSWSLSSAGPLPPGLSISAAGVIGGTPTTSGAYPFTVVVFDQFETSTQANFSITITAAPSASITTTALPNGIVNQAYSAHLLCANCTGYTWSLSSGSLPSGLNLTTSGAIGGTPGLVGPSSFQVALTPPPQFASVPPVTGNFSINIVAGNVSIVQNALPVGFQNTPYTTTLTATGGTPPFTWSFQSTNNDGLAIGLNTGIISGTPTTAGQFALNVMATDSAGSTGSKGFAFTVAASLSILTASLPNGSIGVAYPLQTLLAGGGQPPYRWNISTTGTGNLPPGLTLDGVFGRISGTPTTAGAYPFTLVVTDNQTATASANLSITVGGAITIAPAALPSGTVGVAYTQTLTASGGKAPYTWSTSGGSLPAGLTLNASTGVISGTPTAAATSSFTVQATDSTQAFGTATLSTAIAAAPSVTIATTSLPGGTVGKAYSQTLAATGGQTPYTWSLASGTLPAGTTLNASTGVIGGTPTAAATSNFTVQVSDANKLTAQQPLSIVVTAAVTPFTVTAAALQNGTVGTAYNESPFTVSGGTPPYKYALSSTNGLTIDNTGAISGTPTAAGQFTLMVVVSDSSSPAQQSTQPLPLTVNNPPPPTVTVTGVPATSGFSLQLPVTITLGGTYPADITGTVSLTFAPSVNPSAGVDDAMIQFSSGGRTIDFTIPAGSTKPTLTNASSITILTGTTAGTITVTTTLTAASTPLSTTTKTIVNNSGVPFISSVSFQQTPGGVTVTVVGFSSTRDMVSGLFHFSPASNVTFTQSDITVQLASAFSTWWGNTAQSNPFGTQFTLTVPFTLSTQSTSVVSVTVTLTNSKGASNPVNPQ